MKDDELISIIVPMYNCERYIKECVNSIMNQTYKNFELIIIDDGSKDQSYNIVKKMLSDNCNIKLIKKENGGVSSARNLGMKLASGKWIIFVDADDKCNQRMLEILIQNKSDFTIFGHEKMYKKSVCAVNTTELSNMYNLKQIIDGKFLADDKISGYLWNKMFNLEIIRKNNIQFDENLFFCEDMIFIVKYIEYIQSFKILNYNLYSYRMRINNTMNNVYNKKNLSLLYVYDELSKKYASNETNSKFFQYNYVLCFYKLKKLVFQENINVNYDILKREKELLKNKSMEEKINFIIIKYFPFLYKMFTKFKKYDSNLYE